MFRSFVYSSRGIVVGAIALFGMFFFFFVCRVESSSVGRTVEGTVDHPSVMVSRSML